MGHIRKELKENSNKIEKELFNKGSVYLQVIDNKLIVQEPDNLVIYKFGKLENLDDLVQRLESNRKDLIRIRDLALVADGLLGKTVAISDGIKHLGEVIAWVKDNEK